MEKTKYFTFAGRILKNLFKKPATTQYPFEPADYPARMRGHVEIKIEDCITCGLCARACPSLAIQVDRKAGTWTISRFDCVQCGSCVIACPKNCLTMEKGYTEPDILKKSETFTKPQEEKKEDGENGAGASAGGKPHRVRGPQTANKFQSVICGVYVANNTFRAVQRRSPAIGGARRGTKRDSFT